MRERAASVAAPSGPAARRASAAAGSSAADALLQAAGMDGIRIGSEGWLPVIATAVALARTASHGVTTR
jgi:hypothetical protein